tara:strand:+ start:3931 stop:4737 length:807 start_codon:yes stop_codon:yes gene_type:complete
MIVPISQARLIVSINVFQNIDFMRDQLRNIDTYLDSTLTWRPVLNCSAAFLEELKGTDIFQYCNPVTIDKQRFHGSILNGIVSNMRYAMDNDDGVVFEWFLVMSARTRFAHLLSEQNMYHTLQQYPKQPSCLWQNGWATRDLKSWHWPRFTCTAISHSIDKRHHVGGMHEGLLLTRAACNHIIQRMDLHGDAYDEDCPMEEWVLQSLSTECGEPFLQLAFRYDWFGKAPLRIVDAPWKQTYQLIMGAIIAALLCICVIIVIVIVMVAR